MSDPKPDPAGLAAPAEEIPAKAPEPFTKMTLDTVLTKEIGNFGMFQVRNLLVCMGLVLFTGVANASYIFTTAKIETRCFIPECDSRPATYKPPWMKNAIPDKENKHDSCYRYAPKPGAPAKVAKKGTCPPEMFNRNEKIPCMEYVHANQYSVVYDFALECKEWERTFIGTVRKLGTLTALPVTSYMSDRWGRRIALIFNAVNTAIIGTQRSWVKSYQAYLALDFLEGTFGSGLYSCAYILMVEEFGQRWRVAAGVSVSTFYSIGQAVLGICAWSCPHWRTLTLLIYIPQFTSIFAYWTITESVRWYMAKGKYDQAEALLKKMARVNGRTVLDSSLANMRRTHIEAQEREINDAERIGAGSNLVGQVLSHKRVLLRVLVAPFWWMTTTFIYHGLAINATGVYGNPYQNFILVSLIEIPGYWVAYSLLNKVGRRPVLWAGYWICSLCLLSYMIIPRAYQLLVYMVAKSAIAMVMTSVYCYTLELYPTDNRHKMLVLASAFGRLGSITAPLTPALAAHFYSDLPFVLFSGMAMVSGVLIFFTPETLGTTLPDNFEQAERLGKKELAPTA